MKYNTYRPAPPARPTSQSKRSSRLLFLLILTGVGLIGFHFFGDTRWPGFTGASKKAVAVAPPVLSVAQKNQMAGTINSVIGANPDIDIGVAITDLNDNKSYHYGLNQPFIAASVAKLITATMYLHGVEAGQFSLSDQLSYGTAHYELQQMIEQSDNTAWEDFNALLTHAGLQAYAGSIGLSNYDPDQNTLTVDDIALLLSKLYKGQLLNHTDTQMLLSYMRSANEAGYIVAAVPAGIKVYHKAGWLADRVHDAAIIDYVKHPYVLVIFTKDNSGTYDDQAGHQIFASITAATLQAFTH